MIRWLLSRNPRAGGSPVLKGWIPAFAGITLLCTVAIAQEVPVEDDAPYQGAPEDTANYYIGVKRDGLQPWWKAKVNLAKHEREFVENYRDVRKNKDEKLLAEVLHPATKACENEMRAPYFESMRDFYLNEYFPDAFEVKIFPVQPDRRWELKQRLEFPVAPTHVLYIEYQDGQYKEGLQRYLREEEYPEKRFYELMKCPSEESMEAMIREAEARAEEEEVQ